MGSPACTLGNLCDALLKYYNTSILDHMDMNPELKKACFEEAKVCADTNFAREDKSLKRTVLSELILSHENPATKKPYADFIGGPKSLTLQWSSYYKKLIYIFGEKHSENIDCPKQTRRRRRDNKITMPVEDYIQELYENGDMFSDVYIEAGAFFKNTEPWIETRVSRIPEIRKRFTDCLFKANLNQDCRKGRVHYVDIRHMHGNIKYGNISRYIRIYSLFSEKNKQEYIEYLNKFFTHIQVLEMIKDVSDMDSPEKFIQYSKDEFYANYLLEKELGRSTIKDKITSFIDENIKKYNIQSIIDDIKSLKDMLEQCEDGDSIIFDDDETKTYPSYEFDSLKKENEETQSFYNIFRVLLQQIFIKLISIEAVLMDGYLLARVFKNFNIDVEDVTKRRDTDEPYEPHNIVIYAGDNHSNRYREFLKELGFELIAITGKDWRDKDSTNQYENCISMEGFPQPFFKDHEKVNWLEDASSDKTPRQSARSRVLSSKSPISKRSARSRVLPSKTPISKKSKNGWKKLKSTDGTRIYYANTGLKISQNERPVDYMSGEEEESMQE